MKTYKKRQRCYCTGYPYEKCEVCLPDRKEKRVIKKGIRQKSKLSIKKETTNE